MEMTMRETRPRFRRRVRRTAAAAAATAVAVTTSIVPAVGARAATPKPLFELVGSLDRFAPDARAALGGSFVPTYDRTTVTERNRAGTAVMIPRARQLWQLYPVQNPFKTGVVVRDLDSMKIVRTLQVDDWFDRATIHATEGGDWAHAVDSTGTRLWLLQWNHQSVYEIDLRTFGVKRRFLPGSRSVIVNFPLVVGGMTYDPFTDDLVLLYGGPPANNVLDTNVALFRLDVSVPPTPDFPLADMARLYHVRSCTAPVTSVDSGGETSNWELLVTGDYLYVPCQRAGHTVVVVRLTRPSGVDPNHPEDVTAGPVYADTVLADQASGRMFVMTVRREIWVFETSTMSFIGVVATGPENTDRKTGYGLDPRTGRVFFQSPTFGLGVVEGRFFPIPQARTMARLFTGQERILSDTATGRVFVLEGDGTSITKPAAYRIYTTDPAPIPPSPPDPDRNTIDMAEREGITEARFFANGSGYGTRILFAKGVATIAPAPTIGVLAPTAQLIDKNLKPKCGYTDREFMVGRVVKAEYDTNSTAATAIAVNIDDSTKQDLAQPARCDIPGPLSAQWDRHPATCASSEDTGEVRGQGEQDDLGPSEVVCPQPGGRLIAKAESKLSGSIGVEVDKAWTRTTVERAAAGVTSTVTAVAQGVSIAGVIHLGEIRSVATSLSNGRPNPNPMSVHDVSVREVQIGETVVCHICSDLTAVEDALNRAAGGRAVFRTGEGRNSGLDESLKQGSRRGALTAVQKSPARQASDRALVGDFTVEIPGLEMTVYNDNAEWGRARQIYQFAGVASAATYNVVLRPTGLPFVDDDTGEALGDIAIGNSGNTPFAELTEQFTDDGTALSPTTATIANRDDGGGVLQPLRALARGIRLLFTNPRHSLLLLTAWALFSLPGVLSRRRRLLAGLHSL